MKQFYNKKYDYTIIIIIGIVLFIPSLGKVHLFDWDEINFAESAREMLLTNDYFRVQVNFQPFWEKPPLFIWLQAISMKIFGVNEFAARLPNALTGIGTLCTIYSVGSKYFSRSLAWFWVLAYSGSFLTHLYFKSGIIDPLFNLFIFLGIFYLGKSSAMEQGPKKKLLNIIFAGLCIGAAVLTKGPVALLIALLCIASYSFIKRNIAFTVKEFFIFFFCIACISFCWFGMETIKNGPWFLQEFITYQLRLFKTQDAGHGGPFIYHFIVLYIGCFPASIFIFQGFKNYASDSNQQKILKLWFILSFFVVLILFSIVKTKIIHYSSFCYFPLTFLCAYTINKIYHKEIQFKSFLYYQIGLVGFLISSILIAFPIILKNKAAFISSYGYLIKDPFALANLEAKVYWTGIEFVIGALYLIMITYLILNHKITDIQKIVILFISTVGVISATLNIIVPKIEKYSQGAAIDFFVSLQDKDAYVDVYGYKSYAQLFYTLKKPLSDSLSINKDWLLHGNINKDVYMVSKIDNTNLDSEAGFVRIGTKNGYVFYKRKTLLKK